MFINNSSLFNSAEVMACVKKSHNPESMSYKNV